MPLRCVRPDCDRDRVDYTPPYCAGHLAEHAADQQALADWMRAEIAGQEPDLVRPGEPYDLGGALEWRARQWTLRPRWADLTTATGGADERRVMDALERLEHTPLPPFGGDRTAWMPFTIRSTPICPAPAKRLTLQLTLPPVVSLDGWPPRSPTEESPHDTR